MITEDYVSFEVAKLMKEKGFNENTDKQFNSDKIVGDYNITDRSRYTERYLDAPTLQMSMKWLREVHNKSIEVRSQGLKATSIGWVVGIYNLRTQDEEYHHPYTFPTYEEACEEAIKYCLENLI